MSDTMNMRVRVQRPPEHDEVTVPRELIERVNRALALHALGGPGRRAVAEVASAAALQWLHDVNILEGEGDEAPDDGYARKGWL